MPRCLGFLVSVVGSVVVGGASGCAGDVFSNSSSTGAGSAGAGGSGETSAASSGTSSSASGSGEGGTGPISGAATTTTSGTTSSSSTGGNCGDCSGFSCCGTTCVNFDNDILNCGGRGTICTGVNPFCDKGTCGDPPCEGETCDPTAFCCGGHCCVLGELCCDVPGPVSQGVQCMPPTLEGTCPKGCLDCECTSPDTPIATPTGERRIADLAVGDLVYSVQDDAVVVVPIARVNRVAVSDHHVVRVVLDSGSLLEISAEHPTADGRIFEDLRVGDRLGEARVVVTSVVPYGHAFTYDLLPASATGTYFAGGALIGSTLYGPRVVVDPER